MILEELELGLEVFITESSANLLWVVVSEDRKKADTFFGLTYFAHTLKLLRVLIIAGHQVPSINTSSFASAKVGPNDNQVNRVTHSFNVVFLDLSHVSLKNCKKKHTFSQL